jgi:hypothetical protein
MAYPWDTTFKLPEVEAPAPKDDFLARAVRDHWNRDRF